MKRRLELTIYGIVQGVGYRYLSRNEAQRKGFTGYVKNLGDGSVRLVVEGKEQDLKNFVQWCYNGVGPATVYNIEESWLEATGEFSDFVIR